MHWKHGASTKRILNLAKQPTVNAYLCQASCNQFHKTNKSPLEFSVLWLLLKKSSLSNKSMWQATSHSPYFMKNSKAGEIPTGCSWRLLQNADSVPAAVCGYHQCHWERCCSDHQRWFSATIEDKKSRHSSDKRLSKLQGFYNICFVIRVANFSHSGEMWTLWQDLSCNMTCSQRKRIVSFYLYLPFLLENQRILQVQHFTEIPPSISGGFNCQFWMHIKRLFSKLL